MLKQTHHHICPFIHNVVAYPKHTQPPYCLSNGITSWPTAAWPPINLATSLIDIVSHYKLALTTSHLITATQHMPGLVTLLPLHTGKGSAAATHKPSIGTRVCNAKPTNRCAHIAVNMMRDVASFLSELTELHMRWDDVCLCCVCGQLLAHHQRSEWTDTRLQQIDHPTTQN